MGFSHESHRTSPRTRERPGCFDNEPNLASRPIRCSHLNCCGLPAGRGRPRAPLTGLHDTPGVRSAARCWAAGSELCVLNVAVFAAAMSGQATRHERTSFDIRPAKLRASPKQTTGTASPRRPGTVLSVPPVRRHCATHHCQPGFIRAARPRRRRPAPPSHRRRRPLSASLPKPPGSPANRHVSVSARPSRALPADGMRHIHASRFAAHPDDAERGAESFPISFVAPRRRLPAGHPSPGFVPRRRRTRRVRRLDSHRAPRADLVLPNDVPDRSSDVPLIPARRRVVAASHSSGTGRHIDGGASALQSAATIPHRHLVSAARRSAAPASRRGAGALRHEPVMT